MVILGLLLVLAGAAVIVSAVFTAEVTGGDVEILGIEVGALTLFVLGVISGIAILWGFSIGKFGARRSWRQRRENQRLEELSEKLDRVEAERRRDVDGDDSRQHPHL
jgi:hypothetical protein